MATGTATDPGRGGRLQRSRLGLSRDRPLRHYGFRGSDHTNGKDDFLMPHRSSAALNPNHVHVIGIGRSGTSWLLKIFDHHPEVLALHEPELVLGKSMHRLVAHTTTSTRGFASRDLERARRALLFSSRPLRAVRRRPILRKDTRSGPAHAARNLLIYGLSALERAAPKAVSQALRAVSIPDLGHMPKYTVVKSVGILNGLERVALNRFCIQRP